MDAEQLISTFENYEGQVSYTQTIQEKDAENVSPDSILPNKLSNNLPFSLYSHQVRALHRLDAGKNICITTPTNSGKTMVYALHVARQAIKTGGDSNAMLISPTKSHAREQFIELNAFFKKLNLDISVGIYDSNIGRQEKDRVRKECDVIITNFEDLNYYLPHHDSWGTFFENLETIIMNKSHLYTGLYGTNVAWIIRRLLRIVQITEHASDPQMILTSAPVGNSEEHSKKLTSKDVTIIDGDGGLRGKQDVVVWNPQSKGNINRKSSHKDATDIFTHLLNKNETAVLLTSSRQQLERCVDKITEDNQNKRIVTYYGDNTQKERREIQQGVKDGNIDGIITTNSLDGQISAKHFDATVFDGYPTNRMSFWQYVGNSGASNNTLTVLVAQNNSIDQYIAQNREYLFEDDIEKAIINLKNEHIFEKHLLAAAREYQLGKSDGRYFGARLRNKFEEFKENEYIDGTLEEGTTYTGPYRPETDINIHALSSISDYKVVVQDDRGNSFSLPAVSETKALRELHDGAIYLHRDDKYEVSEVDTDDNTVHLEPISVDYYTRAEREADIVEISSDESYDHPNGLTLHKGSGKVRESYEGFVKIHEDGETEIIRDLDRTIQFETDIIWIEIDDVVWEHLEHVSETTPFASIHGAERGLIEMSPTRIALDSGILGGKSVETYKESGKPTVFMYDSVDGGMGFSHAIYHELGPLAEATEKRIEKCNCENPVGCRACIGGRVVDDELDKAGARYLLKQIYDI